MNIHFIKMKKLGERHALEHMSSQKWSVIQYRQKSYFICYRYPGVCCNRQNSPLQCKYTLGQLMVCEDTKFS